MNDTPQRLERFEAIGEALHWVRVTELQVERFVESFLTESEDVRRPPSFLHTIADAHFLLNAAAQAEKAVKYLDTEIVTAKSALTLRSLRNVHEHWEQHKRSFASPQFAKKRAGRQFSETHPDAIPWNFRIDATGTWISVLRIEDLWNDLLAAEANLARELIEEAAKLGLPVIDSPAEANRPFPRRESKVLGIALVTQNIIIDFDSVDQA